MAVTRLPLDTHGEVERLLLARNGVVTVVEVEAVLTFLSPRANHHVELWVGRRGLSLEASRQQALGRRAQVAGQGLTLKLYESLRWPSPSTSSFSFPLGSCVGGCLCGWPSIECPDPPGAVLPPET